jgi:AraC-like DNA-binding protein
MDQIRISHTLPAMLEGIGVAPADLLRRARLPQTLFDQERVAVSTAQWFALWRALEQLSGDPALGLRLVGDVQNRMSDPLLITALSARSFHEALLKMAHYKRLFCPEDIRILERDGAWSVEVVWLVSQEPTPDLLIDSIFASLLVLGRHGTGLPLVPERIALRRGPLHRAIYEAHFGCPVDFGAERDLMIYSREALRQPFRTYNPDMLAMLEPQLEAALRDQRRQQTVLERVRALLRNRLAGRQPTIRDIAAELNMSVRTLQRRLADEGAHFQQVLEAVRRELARQYLKGSAFDLGEIAYLLGYEEASSFHRAFHLWEGTSPGQWRSAQREGLPLA